jgi:integrase/recombinase XerD
MSASPSLGDASVRRYIQQLSLRSPGAPRHYHHILSRFQSFVDKDAGAAPLSVKVIEDWLRHHATLQPLPVVLYDARLVDRFLDWAVETRSLPINPFAELRKQYLQRTTAPVVRALLSPDSTAALEALLPPVRFGSFLGPTMRDYVALMKSVGHRYTTEERGLLRFDSFLQQHPDLRGQPLKRLVREWADTTPTAEHAWRCSQIGRTLSKALRRLDPTIELVLVDGDLEKSARQLHRRPYIYSEEEVRQLLEMARNFPSPRSPLRPPTLYTMLVLAYCAGLRLGEIVRLNVGDVDLGGGTIEIRDTKFFKSRRLPLASSVLSALRSYLDARQQAGVPNEPAAGLFWQQRTAERYSYVAAGMLLRRVLMRAELNPREKPRPRIHDLRHAFVVNRMLMWYREGINPQPLLPYLATYLGHKDVNSTLVYLTITQELLQQAGERFRARAAAVLGPATGRIA